MSQTMWTWARFWYLSAQAGRVKARSCALNGLQPVDSGTIVIDGAELTSSKTDLNKLRQDVGMVFQHFNLIEHKTALENISMPQMVVLKRSRSEAEEIGNKLLTRVGIGDKGDSYPSELSGGQQQRVAIARSLAMTPKSCCLTRRHLLLIRKLLAGSWI